MSPEEPAKLVENLLNSLRPVGPGTYLLHANHGILRCSRASAFDDSATLVLRLNNTDVNEGLTPKQWSIVCSKIRTLRKNGAL